jgi:GH24 family phage-related lysozyme (muramidase)
MAELNDKNPAIPTTMELSDKEMRAVFEKIIQDYETEVNKWLPNIPESTERAALVSLAYNSPSLLGKGLKDAITNGNHAEAWYEIRYNSNGGTESKQGVANRRFAESDMFGYDADGELTNSEARDLIKTYEKHKDKIDTYEKEYGRDQSSIKGDIQKAYDVLKSNNNNLPIDDIIDQISSSFNIAETTLSPIILDLNDDGVATTNVYGLDGSNSLSSSSNPASKTNLNSVFFDHNNDNFSELTAWVDKNDALLVRDLNNDNKITSGSELFGNNTKLNSGLNASNGFEALKELDSNNDNQIDANDLNFDQLKIWQDSNQDGKTNEGELKTLSEAGIKSINLNYINSNYTDSNNNIHKQTSTYTTDDGEVKEATDVWFQTNQIYSKSTTNIIISDEIKSLPNIDGYGKVHSLHEAMQLDVSGS